MEGIPDAELVCYLKMVGDVASVRGIKGWFKDGICCRHCSINENFIIETLPYVLGQCPFGSLLCNDRHYRIRTVIICDEFRKNSNWKILRKCHQWQIVVP